MTTQNTNPECNNYLLYSENPAMAEVQFDFQCLAGSSQPWHSSLDMWESLYTLTLQRPGPLLFPSISLFLPLGFRLLLAVP